eukprot:3398080-Rhodomonas_salina.3
MLAAGRLRGRCVRVGAATGRGQAACCDPPVSNPPDHRSCVDPPPLPSPGLTVANSPLFGIHPQPTPGPLSPHLATFSGLAPTKNIRTILPWEGYELQGLSTGCRLQTPRRLLLLVKGRRERGKIERGV